ncbi:hypothetical protein BH20ACI2_BH20ACI2_18860 [soil metagenome]
MSNEVSVEKAGRTTVIRFTNASARNPLSTAVLAQLHRIIDDVGSRHDIKVLVFTGTGEVFASGANLREIALLTKETAPEFARLGQSLMNKISEMPQTTIAAVNGFCFGGALDLALSCDQRIAAPYATFAHPGTGLGIITGWGGTQRLPRLVGRTNALELFFTAEPITAERAFRIGLVDLVANDIFNNELLSLDRNLIEVL